MLGASTHDTKRSEDVRARINLLSEIPDEWCNAVLRWSKMNERHRPKRFSRPERGIFLLPNPGRRMAPAPRPAAGLFWKRPRGKPNNTPIGIDRNAQYDEALKHFVTATVNEKTFIEDLEKFVSKLAVPAQINSLAQALLKLTAPGVPDVYQGNEIWDFSLVDPDNRRTVDYPLRQRLLLANARVSNWAAGRIQKHRCEALPKIWLRYQKPRRCCANIRTFSYAWL